MLSSCERRRGVDGIGSRQNATIEFLAVIRHSCTHPFPMASSSKSNTPHVDEDVDDLDGIGSDLSSTLIVLISGQ